MEGLNETDLRDMSYSSLKKYAKKFGVKGNMKADKIIKSILSRSITVSDDDSFLIHEQQIMNSYAKSEHCKFDEDKENQLNSPFPSKQDNSVDTISDKPNVDDPAATPRRGTFTVESPSKAISQFKESELATSTMSKAMETVIPMELSFTSEMKLVEPVVLNASKRRETFSMESPSLPQKDTSVNTKSSRKSRKPKVSFVTPRCSPRLNSSSSGYASVKDRPKTPATSKNSQKKGVQFQASSRVTPYKKISDFLRSRPSTPYRLESGMRRTSFKNNGNILAAITFTPESERETSDIASGSKPKNPDTLQNTPGIKKRDSSTLKVTPGIKKRDSSTPKLTPGTKVTNLMSPKLSTLKKQKGSLISKVNINTPMSTHKTAAAAKSSTKTANINTPVSTHKPAATKSETKRTATPNFQKIHQKAFMKMESIDEYHKRKLDSAKKKQPPVKRFSNTPSKYLKKGSGKKAPLSKIPVFNAVSFVPVITSTKVMTFDFGAKESNVSRNTRLQKASAAVSAVKMFSAGDKNNSKVGDKSSSKKSFDLQASLARKLTYIPHKGVLKPLSEYNTSVKKSVKRQKEKNIQKIRDENKKFIHGVRTNRKFDDMMKRRQI